MIPLPRLLDQVVQMIDKIKMEDRDTVKRVRVKLNLCEWQRKFLYFTYLLLVELPVSKVKISPLSFALSILP